MHAGHVAHAAFAVHALHAAHAAHGVVADTFAVCAHARRPSHHEAWHQSKRVQLMQLVRRMQLTQLMQLMHCMHFFVFAQLLQQLCVGLLSNEMCLHKLPENVEDQQLTERVPMSATLFKSSYVNECLKGFHGQQRTEKVSMQELTERV